MGLLLPVVLRALAVTLLLTTVLLPAADHHALARLAGVAAPGQDAHWLLVHHHGHRPTVHAPQPVEAGLPAVAADLGALEAAPATEPGMVGPGSPAPATVLVAAGAPTDALGLGAPLADLLPLALTLGLLFWRLDRGGARQPRSPTRAVPIPPPRLLLAVAA